MLGPPSREAASGATRFAHRVSDGSSSTSPGRLGPACQPPSPALIAALDEQSTAAGQPPKACQPPGRPSSPLGRHMQHIGYAIRLAAIDAPARCHAAPSGRGNHMPTATATHRELPARRSREAITQRGHAVLSRRRSALIAESRRVGLEVGDRRAELDRAAARARRTLGQAVMAGGPQAVGTSRPDDFQQRFTGQGDGRRGIEETLTWHGTCPAASPARTHPDAVMAPEPSPPFRSGYVRQPARRAASRLRPTDPEGGHHVRHAHRHLPTVRPPLRQQAAPWVAHPRRPPAWARSRGGRPTTAGQDADSLEGHL